MTTATIDTARLKENVDLREIAAQRTDLRKESSSELAGPCPKCAGSDRFHVTKGWAFCRQCWPKGGDPIAFLRWIDGLSFTEACERLAGGAVATAAGHRRPAAPKRRTEKRSKPTFDTDRAEKLLSKAQQALWTSDPAIEYLRGRGLESHTWLAYGLGYVASSPTAERAPAIVLPWYRAGQLAALRFRFLTPAVTVDKQGREHATKIKALKGSQFAGILFGGQAEPLPHAGRTLVISEGELNAVSIWQVAHESRLDVLSVGSESARLTPAMLAIAQQYGSVLVWADRAEVAKKQALEIGAHAINSPGDKDANDLLCEGALGYALAFWRYQTAESTEQREALLWALWDAALLPAGVDAGTAKMIGKLASDLKKEARLIEAEPGRYITER